MDDGAEHNNQLTLLLLLLLLLAVRDDGVVAQRPSVNDSSAWQPQRDVLSKKPLSPSPLTRAVACICCRRSQ